MHVHAKYDITEAHILKMPSNLLGLSAERFQKWWVEAINPQTD